ncbi:hypothetical protein PENARI_c002G09177 [Penicillium arizonense]|uniref:Uncharacterized protein n=1 Tax=Penicillium arizonense TaxID=1835702 RepID=A0A1F5LUA8_PENAI|nr:hypothetical protein PENARI_c002G09177 [Penicillium arizonense]OGE56778.1 hypothetical protein PENARI_c002G09177 [Penicillium arizonense]
MVSSTINFSSLMCLVLALAPSTVLSAPQIPGLPVPDLFNHPAAPTDKGPGNSDSEAGSGVHVAIPGGPYVNAGVGYKDSHRGPCGPGSGDDHHAGAGVDVGIPGGPSVKLGNGEHSHHDGYPCPEPPAPAPVVPVMAPAPAPTAPTVIPAPAYLPPTFTTPIFIPTTTPAAVWSPAVPVVQHSTPLIPRPAPSASPAPSVMPIFNGASSMAPGSSILAVALPLVMAFFY